MTVKKVPEPLKNAIAYEAIKLQTNQVDLAAKFGYSRRTIQRVLEEKGILNYNYGTGKKLQRKPVEAKPVPSNVTPLKPQWKQYPTAAEGTLPSPQDKSQQTKLDFTAPQPTELTDDQREILSLLAKLELDSHKLKEALSKPSLNPANIHIFLSHLDQVQLAELFYQVSMSNRARQERGQAHG